jgi:hypothetical protein
MLFESLSALGSSDEGAISHTQDNKRPLTAFTTCLVFQHPKSLPQLGTLTRAVIDESKLMYLRVFHCFDSHRRSGMADRLQKHPRPIFSTVHRATTLHKY